MILHYSVWRLIENFMMAVDNNVGNSALILVHVVTNE